MRMSEEQRQGRVPMEAMITGGLIRGGGGGHWGGEATEPAAPHSARRRRSELTVAMSLGEYRYHLINN
ncbi:unnamed protein product [Nezara viridula]|uniref:Uncharacterized protein n=1 Tax=Nezara viridula TaxID=85310 RepID=A0A9P0E1S8_NEZVI|nr:unnamed protein product [Nezara viridula]